MVSRLLVRLMYLCGSFISLDVESRGPFGDKFYQGPALYDMSIQEGYVKLCQLCCPFCNSARGLMAV